MKSDISINTEKLSEILAKLEEKTNLLNETFSNMDKEMKKFDGSEKIWKGKTQEILYSGYMKVSKEYPAIIEQLNVYNKFLHTTIDDYKKTEKRIDSDINRNSEDLDVN